MAGIDGNWWRIETCLPSFLPGRAGFKVYGCLRLRLRRISISMPLGSPARPEIELIVAFLQRKSGRQNLRTLTHLQSCGLYASLHSVLDCV